MAQATHLTTYAEAGKAADDRSAEELRHDIAARREVIADTVDRLSERVHQTLDWREYVAQRPLVSVGIAAGLGLLIAAKMFKPRPTPRERIMDALSETIEDLTDRLRGQFDQLPLKKRSGPGRTVKAAATGVITKAITDYVGKQLRGATDSRRRAAWDSESDYRADYRDEGAAF
jgi:ElaB/YqjD/DUF883 family membrane-anchored ribosome-binding protein